MYDALTNIRKGPITGTAKRYFTNRYLVQHLKDLCDQTYVSWDNLVGSQNDFVQLEFFILTKTQDSRKLIYDFAMIEFSYDGEIGFTSWDYISTEVAFDGDRASIETITRAPKISSELIYNQPHDFLLLGPELYVLLGFDKQLIKDQFVTLVKLLRVNRENAVLLYIFLKQYAHDINYSENFDDINFKFDTIDELHEFGEEFPRSYSFDDLYEKCLARIDNA